MSERHVTPRRPPMVAEYRVRWRRASWITDHVSEVTVTAKASAHAIARQLENLAHGPEGRVVYLAIERRLVSPWTSEHVAVAEGVDGDDDGVHQTEETVDE